MYLNRENAGNVVTEPLPSVLLETNRQLGLLCLNFCIKKSSSE
jgi:hypothetical protein